MSLFVQNTVMLRQVYVTSYQCYMKFLEKCFCLNFNCLIILHVPWYLMKGALFHASQKTWFSWWPILTHLPFFFKKHTPAFKTNVLKSKNPLTLKLRK